MVVGEIVIFNLVILGALEKDSVLLVVGEIIVLYFLGSAIGIEEEDSRSGVVVDVVIVDADGERIIASNSILVKVNIIVLDGVGLTFIIVDTIEFFVEVDFVIGDGSAC